MQRDIVSLHSSSCKVPVIIVRFWWNLNSLDRFSKNTQVSDLMRISPLGTEFFRAYGRTDGRTDRQTDMTNLIITFWKFPYAPEKVTPSRTLKWFVHQNSLCISTAYPARLIVIYFTFLSNPHETIKSSSCLYSNLTCFLTSFLLDTYSHSWQANISQQIKKYPSLHGGLIYKSGNVHSVLSSCLLLRYLLCTQMPL